MEAWKDGVGVTDKTDPPLPKSFKWKTRLIAYCPHCGTLFVNVKGCHVLHQCHRIDEPLYDPHPTVERATEPAMEVFRLVNLGEYVLRETS